MAFSFLLVLSAILVAGTAGHAMRRTPFGPRPDECVLPVPHGSMVEDHPDGSAAVLVTPVNGTAAYRHDTPAICRLHALASLAATPLLASQGALELGKEDDDHCNRPNCTCDSLPCNNWIDNAGAMNTTTFIGGMKATYVTPDSPASSSSGNQTLFYFIGAENTDGSPRAGPPATRAILQPVLTFDPSGWCESSATGWCFASWYCCPQDLVVHSAYIQNVEPGERFYGAFNLSADGQNFTVVSRSERTKQETSLVCPRQGRNFNWADVTLEVYGMASCDDFAVGKMKFLNVSLWDVAWQAMAPSWLFTSGKPCAGDISYLRDTVPATGAPGVASFYISHNEGDAPSSGMPPATREAIIGGVVGGMALVGLVLLAARRVVARGDADSYQAINEASATTGGQ